MARTEVMLELRRMHACRASTGKARRPTVESLTARRTNRLSVVEDRSLCRERRDVMGARELPKVYCNSNSSSTVRATTSSVDLDGRAQACSTILQRCHTPTGVGLTQPSILKWSVNRVPACLAGVEAGCVRLCRMAGNTV